MGARVLIVCLNEEVVRHLQMCNSCFYQVSKPWPMGLLFIQTVTLILPTRLQINWLSVQEKKFKIDFLGQSEPIVTGLLIGAKKCREAQGSYFV